MKTFIVAAALFSPFVLANDSSTMRIEVCKEKQVTITEPNCVGGYETRWSTILQRTVRDYDSCKYYYPARYRTVDECFSSDKSAPDYKSFQNYIESLDENSCVKKNLLTLSSLNKDGIIADELDNLDRQVDLPEAKIIVDVDDNLERTDYLDISISLGDQVAISDTRLIDEIRISKQSFDRTKCNVIDQKDIEDTSRSFREQAREQLQKEQKEEEENNSIFDNFSSLETDIKPV